MAVAAGTCAWVLEHKATAVSERVSAEAAFATGARLPPNATVEPAVDFARSLPSAVPMLQAVARVEEAARAEGLVIGKLAVSQRPASPDALGRAEVSIDMRGSYPAVKTMLRETLARHPSMSAAHLRIRSEPNAATVDASATLSIWTSPRAPPAGAPVHGPGHGR
jgi:hypothetical protein